MFLRLEGFFKPFYWLYIHWLKFLKLLDLYDEMFFIVYSLSVYNSLACSITQDCSKTDHLESGAYPTIAGLSEK